MTFGIIFRFSLLLFALAANSYGDTSALKPVSDTHTSTPTNYRVLHISSYHAEYSWTALCSQGLRAELPKHHTLHTLYLDAKRLPIEEVEHNAKQAKKQALKLKPDLVVLGDDLAVKLLADAIGSEGIPVVYYGVSDNPRAHFPNGRRSNILGIQESPYIIPWTRHIGRLIPSVKNILVLFDGSVSSQSILDTDLHGQLITQVGAIRLQTKLLNNLDEWRKEILLYNNTRDYDAVIIGSYFKVTDKGKPVDPKDVLDIVARGSRIPIFGLQDFAVRDDGAVGAMAEGGVAHGGRAGIIAHALLTESLTVAKKSQYINHPNPRFYFNKKKLAEYNIHLPKSILEKTTYRQ